MYKKKEISKGRKEHLFAHLQFLNLRCLQYADEYTDWWLFPERQGPADIVRFYSLPVDCMCDLSVERCIGFYGVFSSIKLSQRYASIYKVYSFRGINFF